MTFIETKKRLRDKVFVQEQLLGRWVVLIDYDYYDVIMSSRMSSPRPGRCSRNHALSEYRKDVVERQPDVGPSDDKRI
jgi:hypothetical protein